MGTSKKLRVIFYLIIIIPNLNFQSSLFDKTGREICHNYFYWCLSKSKSLNLLLISVDLQISVDKSVTIFTCHIPIHWEAPRFPLSYWIKIISVFRILFVSILSSNTHLIFFSVVFSVCSVLMIFDTFPLIFHLSFYVLTPITDIKTDLLCFLVISWYFQTSAPYNVTVLHVHF